MTSATSETEVITMAGIEGDEEEDEALRCIIDGELELSAAPVEESLQEASMQQTPPLQVSKLMHF